eukprot:gene174-272_t
MLLAVAVSAALLIAGLPSEKIRASGEKCSDAVRRDMNRAVLLLNKAQAVALAEYEKPDKFPSFYRALDGEVRALTEAPDGNGGAISVFFGSANGALDGISWGAGKYEILKGNPRDTSGRGSLEVYSVSENAESWDLSDLKSNTSFNLAEHAWFITAPTIKWTSPYVFKQDTYASSIGITLSKDSKVWKNALESYGKALALTVAYAARTAKRKDLKKEFLIDDDAFLRNEARDLIECGQFGKAELSRAMRWKLARGTWRIGLQQLVESNDTKLVIQCISNAMECFDSKSDSVGLDDSDPSAARKTLQTSDGDLGSDEEYEQDFSSFGSPDNFLPPPDNTTAGDDADQQYRALLNFLKKEFIEVEENYDDFSGVDFGPACKNHLRAFRILT